MISFSESTNKYLSLLLFSVMLVGLYVLSTFDYLMFHGVVEFFGIVVATSIFMIAWNSRKIMDSNYLLFLGISFLFVSAVRFLHIFAYKGMNVLPGNGANTATQLWIAARYLESLSFLVAPVFLSRRLNLPMAFSGYTVVTAAVIVSIFMGVFPTCWVECEGQGLTLFKNVSEYVIALIFLASIGILLRKKRRFDPAILRLLLWALALNVLAELSFTLYVNVYGLINLLGHFFNIVSSYLIYRALVQTGLAKPYQLLFRDLKQREEMLRKSEEKYRELVQNANSIIVRWNREGRFTFFNEFAQRFFGYGEKEILGQPVAGTIIPETESTGRRLGGLLDEVLKHPEQYRAYENENFRRNGERVWIAWTNRPMLDSDGRITEVLSVGIDITDLKRAQEEVRKARDELELRVQERTAELARSNAELEQFAYVSSHDLQEPLRMVGNFVQLIEMRYNDKLDDDGREFIAYAVEGAKRMSRLIKDLLEFSRVKSRGKAFAPTDCREVLKQVLENLQIVVKETDAQVTFDGLPTVMADDVQMGQVFQNLIENGIKFRRKDVAPQIRVSAEQRDGEWVFSVEDNGIGIEPQYFDKIFVIFQRLHNRQKYPGTGIGLSVVKRIIERHGGRIWLESQFGQGSIFYFSLPIEAKSRPVATS